jgi:signal transduction histidine kinase
MDEVIRSAGPRPTAVLGGVGGALLLAVAMSPDSRSGGLAPFVGPVAFGGLHGEGWAYPIAMVSVIALALGLTRFWPYLLAVAAAVSVTPVLREWPFSHWIAPFPLQVAGEVRGPLALIGVLACAQGLIRRGSPGWGSAVAGLSIGGAVLGGAMIGPSWETSVDLKHVHLAMIGVAALAQAPALYRRPRGEEAVAASGWKQVRLPLTGALAYVAAIPFGLVSTEQLSRLLGVRWDQLLRHPLTVEGVSGAYLLATTLTLALVSGLWSFGGALTGAVTHVAAVAPILLAITALDIQPAARWGSALAGIAIGTVVTAGRWRIPAAAGLALGASVALVIAHAATGGFPEKIADQRDVVPGVVILILITAAGTAVVGATAPVLGPRGALPAALGPLTTVLGAGGVGAIDATYVGSDGEPVSSHLNPVMHLNTSAILLLVAGAAVGGLGLADLFAARRAERKRTEQIRQEAAAAERDRLARPIHDGVLQVLALVQRHGSEMGGPGPELAELAGAQEVALRSLLSGRSTGAGTSREDLRTALMALASPAIDVAAPADPVMLPARAADELSAAVLAALDNVRRHAGPGARAWILLEDEGDGVRVTVRDDGAGFGPDRLAEAAAGGRLGVAQSMRGRIADLGGTTTIHSRPGEGTEVEFWVPRPG